MTGADLKNKRQSLSFSQPELSQILGISLTTLVRWEHADSETISNPLLERALRDVAAEFEPWINLLDQNIELEPLDGETGGPDGRLFQVVKITARHVHLASEITGQKNILVPRERVTLPGHEHGGTEPRAFIKDGALRLLETATGPHWKFRNMYEL